MTRPNARAALVLGATTAAAALARLAFERSVGPASSLLFPFLLPIAAAGISGGLRWALVATGLNTLLVADLWYAPVLDLHSPAARDERLRLAGFAACGLLLAGLCGLLDRERQRAVALLRDARKRGDELALEVAARAAAEGRLVELSTDLERQVAERTALGRAVLDALPAHVAVVDRAGTVIAVNRAWERFAVENARADGISPRTGPGTNYLQVCDAGAAGGCADAAAAAAGLRAVLAGGGPWAGFEYDCGAPGRPRWFALRAGPLPATGGGVVSHTEITERVKAEAAVRASEERFRAFMAHAPFAAWIADADGRGVYTSPGFDRHTGLPPGAYIGRTPADLWPAGIARQFAETSRRVLAGGAAVADEEPFVRADGTAGVAHVVKFPMRGPADEPLVGGVALDVTARKRAEEALAAQEDLLRRFISESPVAVAMFDRDMRYLHASGRWLADYGLTGSVVTGQSHYDLFPNLPEQWRAVHRRVLAGAVERCDEDLFERADGSTEWLEWECRPWHGADGAVGGVLIYAQVITPRKRAEHALRESEELLASFFEAPGSLRGVVELTGDGDIVHLRDNAEAAAFFGRPQDQMRNRRASEMGVSADAIRVWAERYRECRRLNRPVQFEFAAPDGRWLQAGVSPLASPAGERFSYVAWDVTERKRSAEALRESEERFRNAFDNAPIGMALVGTNGRWQRVNRRLCEIVGYTEAELLATDLQAITHPGDLAADLELTRRVLAGAIPYYQMEKRYVHKDGHTVDVLLARSLVRDGAGAPLYFVAQIKDITERKRAERAVAARDALLRQFIKHSPAAIAMFDREVRYLQVSDRWVTDYHLGGRKVIGECHYDVFPDIPDRWKEAHRRVLAGAVERRDEEPFERADGSTEWLQWECRPWYDDDGAIGGLVMFTQVVTARRRAEETLRQSEERLRLALEGASAGCWSWEAGTGDTRWDDQFHRNYGFGPDQPQGLAAWLGSIHPDDRPRVAGRVEQARATPGDDRWEIEFRSLHPERGVRWHYGLGRCERDAAGGLVRVLGIDLDVTDRKRAEEQLRASLREKEVLLKEIHHRVKNNLQIVSALLDLQSGYAADPAAVAMFRESRDRVRSMALIHERLYKSANLAGVDFAEYVQRLADDLFRAYKVGDGVRLELAVDLPPLPVDVAIPCGLLLNELISNSLKHGFRGRAAGTVRVTLARDGASAVLRVADDGTGLPPDFEARRTKSFGLELVHTLTEQIEGAVAFETGPGTTVTVRFPTPEAP